MIVPVEGTVTVRLSLDTDTGLVAHVAGVTDTHAWAPPDGLAMPDEWTAETYADAAAEAMGQLRVEVSK